MESKTKRKILYGAIYVGVAITFPALPLHGLKFVGGIFSGVYMGIKDEVWSKLKEDGKEQLAENLFGKGIITELLTKEKDEKDVEIATQEVTESNVSMFDLEGPVFKIFNPFE